MSAIIFLKKYDKPRSILKNSYNKYDTLKIKLKGVVDLFFVKHREEEYSQDISNSASP